MKVSEKVSFEDFPCVDVVKGAYIVPGVEIDPLKIRAIMISEAAPASASDYYYAEGEPLQKNHGPSIPRRRSEREDDR